MPIQPLPQFEEDLAQHLKEKEDREIYERLSVPTSIVVRFGVMKMVGEFPYSGDAKPGCGSKLVVRTNRGIEIGEMLTSTCPNSGCSKSVSRKEMLQYIDNSGGRNYPFYTDGRVLRIAAVDDLDRQAKLEQSKHGLRLEAKALAARAGIDAKVVDVEPILSQDRITVYLASEERVDVRDLTKALSAKWAVRVDIRHVGARDEARISADYERCGQYCCCKNFLKVLKPVSMRSAKIQKATLDPLKISGRCGRLMCCLRYEDETYDELRRNLPPKKKEVGTPDGDGIVIDTQILTQLALVRLHSGKDVAIPIEELTEPGLTPPPPPPEPMRSTRERREPRADDRRSGERSESRPSRRKRRQPDGDRPAAGTGADGRGPADGAPGGATTTDDPAAPKKKKRRRRRRKPTGEAGDGPSTGTDGASGSGEASSRPPTTSASGPANREGGTGEGAEGGAPKKKRRRRRRRKPGGEGGTGQTDGGSPDSGGGD